MTRKSLLDAVLDVAVKNFTFPPKTFSAYDITKLLRADVNSKLYDIAEFVGLASRFGQEVQHSQVRDTVAKLFDSRHFDRIYNGTFYEYSIGNVTAPRPAKAPDITLEANYTKIIEILSNQSGIAMNLITPNSNLQKDLNFDDLDIVEVIMAIEEELRSELAVTELTEPNSTLITVTDFYNYVKKSFKSSQSTATPTLSGLITPTPVAVVPSTPSKDTTLKLYIKARHNKGVSPSLKNAQKALKSPGTSVREISDIAKSLGFNIVGNKDVPFHNWVISK